MTQTSQSINVNGTPVSAAELMSNAHAHVQPYDEVFANAKATVMHGLVQMLLLARRGDNGRSEPLTHWDRKHLEAVTMRALNCADIDLETDIAADCAGQTATECWREQITDLRVVTRRMAADLLEQLGEKR